MNMVAIVAFCGSAVRWVWRARLAAAAVAVGQVMTCAAANAQDIGPLVEEPLWTTYALTDALFWGRDNQAANQPLVVGVNDGAAIVSGRDLQFPFSEGVRAFYGRRQPQDGGWEIGYWGIYGQSATQIATGNAQNFIQMPQPIGSSLTADGENAIVKYNSTINSAEANIFSTNHEWRDASGSWLTDDWIVGFRYIGVEESSSININCCVNTTDTSIPYAVQTQNNMFGAQVGRRLRWTWERWAIETWGKAGILGNSQQAISAPLVDYTGFQQRPGYSTWGSCVGFVGDINLSTIYRLTDVWGIRAGYNLIWIDGLALAPNQYNFGVNDGAGSALVSGGGVFMNGANLGLEARW